MLKSSCESGMCAGYDGCKRKRDSKVHMAVDALRHMVVVHVTPTDEQERAQVRKLCEDFHQATSHTAQLDWVDQGYARALQRRPKPRNRADHLQFSH